MSNISKCNQKGCDKPAAYRFTWPGNDEAGVCSLHANAVRNISGAMGCYVQLIPLPRPEDAINDPDGMLADGDPGEP